MTQATQHTPTNPLHADKAALSYGRMTLIATAESCELPNDEDAQRSLYRAAELLSMHDDLVAALQCASNVLSLLQDEVKALGLRADRVPEKIAAALAKAKSC